MLKPCSYLSWGFLSFVYVNEYKYHIAFAMGNGTECTQSHRPEQVVPDSYDKFELGLISLVSTRTKANSKENSFCFVFVNL